MIKSDKLYEFQQEDNHLIQLVSQSAPQKSMNPPDDQQCNQAHQSHNLERKQIMSDKKV